MSGPPPRPGPRPAPPPRMRPGSAAAPSAPPVAPLPPPRDDEPADEPPAAAAPVDDDDDDAPPPPPPRDDDAPPPLVPLPGMRVLPTASPHGSPAARRGLARMPSNGGGVGSGFGLPPQALAAVARQLAEQQQQQQHQQPPAPAPLPPRIASPDDTADARAAPPPSLSPLPPQLHAPRARPAASDYSHVAQLVSAVADEPARASNTPSHRPRALPPSIASAIPAALSSTGAAPAPPPLTGALPPLEDAVRSPMRTRPPPIGGAAGAPPSVMIATPSAQLPGSGAGRGGLKLASMPPPLAALPGSSTSPPPSNVSSPRSSGLSSPRSSAVSSPRVPLGFSLSTGALASPRAHAAPPPPPLVLGPPPPPTPPPVPSSVPPRPQQQQQHSRPRGTRAVPTPLSRPAGAAAAASSPISPRGGFEHEPSAPIPVLTSVASAPALARGPPMLGRRQMAPFDSGAVSSSSPSPSPMSLSLSPSPSPPGPALTPQPQDAEDKAFLRVDVSDTFKTLSITPQTTVSDCAELMFKKLCKGKVTDEKLSATKAQYRMFWFYTVGADGAPHKMQGTDSVWEYRTSSILYADSGEDYLQHIAQGVFAAAIAPLPELREIEGHNKDQRLRMRVLYEIVATERDYVNDISVLTEVFINPLKQKPNILSPADFQGIFMDVDTIVSPNVEILKELIVRLPTLLETGDMMVADIFGKMSAFLKMYTIYCTKQIESFKHLDRCMKQPRFAAFLKERETEERCRGLMLNSFLIKPVQRVCKYPLLLRDLISHTPADHPELASLMSALSSIEDVVEFINERKRLDEASQRVLMIQAELGLPDLVTPARRFVREGTLQVGLKGKGKPSEASVYVFNDLILLAKKKKEKWRIQLARARLIVVAEQDTKMRLGFEIREGDDLYQFIAATAEERDEWMAEIKTIIRDYMRQQFAEAEAARDKQL